MRSRPGRRTSALWKATLAAVALGAATPHELPAQAVPTPRDGATYTLTIAHASDGAAWTQTARVQIASAGDSLSLTLSKVRLTIVQASVEQRMAIEEAYRGYDGASATVKIDDRGNILSVANVSSPAGTDGRLPVSEADIPRIVGLCILALPTTAERATIAAGDSWPAQYRTAIGDRGVNIRCR